jgi:hypothetical protein
MFERCKDKSYDYESNTSPGYGMSIGLGCEYQSLKEHKRRLALQFDKYDSNIEASNEANSFTVNMDKSILTLSYFPLIVDKYNFFIDVGIFASLLINDASTIKSHDGYSEIDLAS